MNAGADEMAALLTALRAEEAERERLRALYEDHIGSTDAGYVRMVVAYAAADLRCADLETELERRHGVRPQFRTRGAA